MNLNYAMSAFVVKNFLVCKNDKSISILKEWLRFHGISSDITDDSHLVYNILISHAHISFSCQTTVKQTVKNDISMFALILTKGGKNLYKYGCPWLIQKMENMCIWDKLKRISF